MKALSTGKAVWFVLMLTVGYVFAQLVAWIRYPNDISRSGNDFSSLVSRVSSNRDFYTSGVLIALGAACPALFAGPYGSHVSLLIAGWVLGMGALAAFFRKS